MLDTIREAPIGQLLRYITSNRVLKYPEELPGFELPEAYKLVQSAADKEVIHTSSSTDSSSRNSEDDARPDMTDNQRRERNLDLEKTTTAQQAGSGADSVTNTQSALHQTPSLAERYEIDRQLAVERTKSRPIVPVKTADGIILVDW